VRGNKRVHLLCLCAAQRSLLVKFQLTTPCKGQGNISNKVSAHKAHLLCDLLRFDLALLDLRGESSLVSLLLLRLRRTLRL